MTQLDLFNSRPAHHLHRRKAHGTEKAAAASVAPRAATIRARVLAYARDCGPNGFTLRELEVAFKNPGSTYRTRAAELADLGLIKDTGRRRRYDSVREHIVWAAV